MSTTKEFIVIAYTENHTGVLNRITTLYLRRKINIECLKVSESSIKGISRFSISAFTTESTIIKLVSQLRNIIDVIEVKYYTEQELIYQEMGLYKIAPANGLQEINEMHTLVNNCNARIVEVTSKFAIIERTGLREDIESLRKELDKKGLLLEFTRSGTVVLHRESTESILASKLKELK